MRKRNLKIYIFLSPDENKIFGGYTNCKIEYNCRIKKDNKSFLYSIDINEKFKVKENKYAIFDNDYYLIDF